MNCRECTSSNTRQIGQTCEEARGAGAFHDEHYSDGAYYGEVGVHHVGYECLDCGHKEAEPCIHD